MLRANHFLNPFKFSQMIFIKLNLYHNIMLILITNQLAGPLLYNLYDPDFNQAFNHI